MGVGQYFTALLVTLLVLVPIFDVSPLFATIVEIGFSGGHGTAAGMTQVFDGLGFEAGSALAQLSATVGIISTVVVGIVLINFGIRKGYCANLNQQKGIPAYKRIGLIPEPKRYSIATATVATEAIEPLTFHFSIVSIAILLGWGMLELIRPLHQHLQGFPLFPLAMLGGLWCRESQPSLRSTNTMTTTRSTESWVFPWLSWSFRQSRRSALTFSSRISGRF